MGIKGMYFKNKRAMFFIKGAGAAAPFNRTGRMFCKMRFPQ